MQPQESVQRLWNLCHVLRNGITYHEYVTELTYLKMAEERGGKVEAQLPKYYRWKYLTALDGT